MQSAVLQSLSLKRVEEAVEVVQNGTVNARHRFQNKMILQLFDTGRMLAWRFSLPVSNDGKPLAVSASDLVLPFPSDRLPSNPLVALSLQLPIVLFVVFAYVISIPALNYVVKKLGVNGKSKPFQAAVALHNFSLSIFSSVMAFNIWSVLLHHLANHGFEETYCDRDGLLWSSGLEEWAMIFYLSKYYEFVDTWILIVKGKKLSFLQVYHHAGAILAVWGGVVSHSPWLLIATLLNSVIHSFMYFYFFIKTVYPDVVIKAARHLTSAQIGQFICGIAMSQGHFILGETCSTPASRLSCAFLNLYGIGLVLLFRAFAMMKYKKKE